MVAVPNGQTNLSTLIQKRWFKSLKMVIYFNPLAPDSACARRPLIMKLSHAMKKASFRGKSMLLSQLYWWLKDTTGLILLVLHRCSQKTTNTWVLSHAHDKWCYRTFSGECSWCIHVYRFILRCYKLLAKVLSVKQLLPWSRPDRAKRRVRILFEWQGLILLY